jgi:GNAT superfamily N-acetyltransferase
MPVTIRPITLADMDLVRDVLRQMLTDSPHAFGETLAELNARSPEEWQAWVAHFSNPTQAQAFVAEDALGSCGFLCADANDPRPPKGAVLVSRVWAAPRQRGTGLGKALMEAATHWATAQSAEQIMLGVLETNVSVLKFYEHLGYSDTGIRAPVDDTTQVIVLGRRLIPA